MGKKLKFVDLFAGLGGFHTALSNIGMECVFACEIDESLRKLYYENYSILPEGDIRYVKEENIPRHDILCAGFPCQPFSLAGSKKGAKCPKSGKLIEDVFRIIKYHKPEYIFLENVPNILTIENGAFWKLIENTLISYGYKVDYRIYSPTDFGIPQKRKRVFIIAKKDSHSCINWPTISATQIQLLDFIAEKHGEIERQLEPAKQKAITLWGELIGNLSKITYHVIITAEFGATYPVTGFRKMKLSDARTYKGAWGCSLENCRTWKDISERLPHYINSKTLEPAAWLRDSIIESRRTHQKNTSYFNRVKKEFMQFPQSWQKLQWQGARDNLKIWDHLIQFRASGIRVIKPLTAPSLVAMTTTQIPIIGKEKRYMNEREAASLQGLHNLKALPSSSHAAFKAIGNAVNSNIVREVACAAIA